MRALTPEEYSTLIDFASGPVGDVEDLPECEDTEAERSLEQMHLLAWRPPCGEYYVLSITDRGRLALRVHAAYLASLT